MTRSASLSKYVRVDTSAVRLARLWTGVSQRLEPEGQRRGAWLKLALVGALLALLPAGLFAWAQHRLTPSTSAWHAAALETSTDGLTVDLDDGSRLELSARTRVNMLGEDPRAASVRIDRGRVACDITKRPGRRFSVLARDIEVRVTGTRFTVELEPATGRVEIVVERGSVVVLRTGQEAPGHPLRAGERWSITSPLATPSAGPAPQRTASRLDTSLSASPAESAPARAARTSDAGTHGAAASGAIAPTPPLEAVTASSLFDRANVARRSGDMSGAARAYQALLDRFPTDSHAGLAAFELGRLRMGSLGDLAGAIRALNLAVGLLSGSTLREDAMARLVEAYAASGMLSACQAARSAYLREYPNGVHALLVTRQCDKR